MMRKKQQTKEKGKKKLILFCIHLFVTQISVPYATNVWQLDVGNRLKNSESTTLRDAW